MQFSALKITYEEEHPIRNLLKIRDLKDILTILKCKHKQKPNEVQNIFYPIVARKISLQ